MSSGAIVAWSFETRQPIELQWCDGIIVRVQRAAPTPAQKLWIAPGLLDLQINGFGGIDFQQDNLTAENLDTAVETLRAAGCTRFLLTLITEEWPRLIARLKYLRALRAQSAELSAAIAGWHIEGPFLSAEPGYCGAHEPALMRDPAPSLIRELRAATGDDPLLLTLAPERSGALESITLAVSLGMRVSLGHTNASVEVFQRAVKAGASGFTHLGNACPRELDRHDNIVWRALDTPGLMVSLIPDGIHVSPSFFRLAHRVLGPQDIYYTTDAMAAAGVQPGCYSLGRLRLEVGMDQAAMLSQDWREVWARFSEQPAKWMGLAHSMEKGNDATFCLVELNDCEQIKRLRVFWRGTEMNAALSG